VVPAGVSVFPALQAILEAPGPDPGDERRSRLEAIAEFVRTRPDPQLVFICTHNSRRSQMAQIWAQAASAHFAVHLSAHSGGTEVTALHPHAVDALREAGFLIESAGQGNNPRYEARYAEGGSPITLFSKVYDSAPNPSSGFCAVMTCSTADADCPVVTGAARRVALPYDDPKDSDGTGREAEVYGLRCRQIAAEMAWMVRRARA
jgi:arsenate reductase